MAGRGKPGREPDRAKREAFAALIAKGVSSGQASRIVEINPRTGKRWRKGRKVVSSSGGVLEYAPVIATRTRSRPVLSGRFLSQDERIRIADLRRDGLSVRQVASRLGRAASTVSRELRRHAREDGSYRPFEAHRQALKAVARPRRSRLAGDDPSNDREAPSPIDLRSVGAVDLAPYGTWVHNEGEDATPSRGTSGASTPEEAGRHHLR